MRSPSQNINKKKNLSMTCINIKCKLRVDIGKLKKKIFFIKKKFLQKLKSFQKELLSTILIQQF
jgi:hypothetical protein